MRRPTGTGRVSVIIPTHNRAQLLPRAIGSVLRQTAAEVCDIVVVDDGSTDATAAVVARYGRAVRLLRQEHAGAAAARNAGIRATDGEFVAFLDSDDEWAPDKIAAQLAALARWPEAVFVSGASVARYPDREEPRVTDAVPHDVPADFAPALCAGNFLFTPTVLVRRTALDAVGLFCPALRRRHDYHLWVRLACHGRGIYLSRLLAWFAVGAAGSLSAAREEALLAELDARRRLRTLLARRPECRLPWRRAVAGYLRSLRDRAYARGDYAAAAGYAVELLREAPEWPAAWEWRRLVSCVARMVWAPRAAGDKGGGR